MKYTALLIFAGILFVATPLAAAGPLDETRIVDRVIRNNDGTIYRSMAVRSAFRRLYACPSTGSFKGACFGHAIDHVIPLSECGADAV